LQMMAELELKTFGMEGGDTMGQENEMGGHT
jgi:hypothetical protein